MKSLSTLIPPSELLAAKADVGQSIAGVTDSSRDASSGQLFFAVRGARSDGHGYVAQALAQGAAAVVVEDRDCFEAHPRAILVGSTRLALSRAASRWEDEPTRSFRLVGITGTNGKTTSTFLLKHIWSALGLTSGIVGTVEYDIAGERERSTLTTPGPLGLQKLFSRMRTAKVSHAAMEVSSIALDQARVGGSAFEVALFTNLTLDHLDYHLDFESYFAAKRKLFHDYPLRRAVVNIDDPWGRKLFEGLEPEKRISFSLENRSADFYASELSFAKAGSSARIETPSGEVSLVTPLIGKHNLYNCLGALAVEGALGHDLARAGAALANALGAPGRLERVMTGSNYPHVFVDYAHTDDALRNVLTALTALKRQGPGKVITVFGCGGDRDRSKRPKMGEIASSLSDITIATSDNPRTESPDRIIDEIENGIDRTRTTYHRAVDRRAAIHEALRLAQPDDIVLVAGKGHETYQIIGREEFPFDDREVIRDYYRSL